MTDPDFVEETDPQEVFALLANDIRVGILQALWEIDDGAATFSELREAVGTDDSGQFNYHLGKLVDRFVARTDDGYALTHEGQLINGSIAAGTYTMAGEIDPITLEEACPTCGGTRTLHYDGEQATVECDSCPVTGGFVLPPGVLAGYDRETIPTVASRYLRTSFHGIDSGFCLYCEGRVRSSIGSIPDVFDTPLEEIDDVPESLAATVEEVPWVRYECERCGTAPTASLDLVFLDHPAVAGFYYDRGIDVTGRSIWEIGVPDPNRSEIVEREPFRARVTYRVEGDAVTLTVDDRLDVVGVDR